METAANSATSLQQRHPAPPHPHAIQHETRRTTPPNALRHTRRPRRGPGGGTSLSVFFVKKEQIRSSRYIRGATWGKVPRDTLMDLKKKSCEFTPRGTWATPCLHRHSDQRDRTGTGMIAVQRTNNPLPANHSNNSQLIWRFVRSLVRTPRPRRRSTWSSAPHWYGSEAERKRKEEKANIIWDVESGVTSNL